MRSMLAIHDKCIDRMPAAPMKKSIYEEFFLQEIPPWISLRYTEQNLKWNLGAKYVIKYPNSKYTILRDNNLFSKSKHNISKIVNISFSILNFFTQFTRSYINVLPLQYAVVYIFSNPSAFYRSIIFTVTIYDYFTTDSHHLYI